MSDTPISVPLIPDCSACIINSLGRLIPLLTDDLDEQHSLFRFSYKFLSSGYRERKNPLTLSVELYQELYTKAGVYDPYVEIKAKSNAAALKALPFIDERITELSGYHKFRATIAAAIAGNMIDFNTAEHEPILEELESVFIQIMDEGFDIDDSEYLWNKLTTMKGKVLVLADNTGETILDIPMLRFLNDLGWKVVYVVKGKPMINDATEDDIRGTEIEDLAEITNSGAWAHGVPKRWVSKEFLERVGAADLVLSKGQANIESFPEIQLDYGVETYYITRAKCSHISMAIGASKYDNVVLKSP